MGLHQRGAGSGEVLLGLRFFAAVPAPVKRPASGPGTERLPGERETVNLRFTNTTKQTSPEGRERTDPAVGYCNLSRFALGAKFNQLDHFTRIGEKAHGDHHVFQALPRLSCSVNMPPRPSIRNALRSR